MLDSEIKSILTNYKKITVLGMSPKEDRPSHKVSKYLLDVGYEVDGVHPKETEILGCPIYKNFQEVPHELEIVDVFRAPKHIPQIVDELIPLKPKAIWLQEGVVHPEAEEKARQAGIWVISDICILKEHKRLFL